MKRKEEKELLKKSGIYTIIVLLVLSAFCFLFSIQTSFGYSGTGTAQDLKSGSRLNGDLLAQPLNGSVTIYFGTQSTQGTGTTGYIGTNTAGLPFLRYSFLSGSSSINFSNFGAVYIDSIAIPSASSVSGKIDVVGGTGTTNVFTDTTLAGVGTITASFGANGLVISPAEYASVNNATGELQSQITTTIGSITNHAHTGGDGTTQVSHANLTSKGTQTHTQIDNFIASKGATSGIASLDANTLVVQNPASGTSTPGASKIVMSDGTSKILDGWLSNNVTKLGTPTTSNIAEGSNLYFENARVNAAVGSLSVNVHSDMNVIMNENDFLKIVGGQIVAGSSTATVAFSEVTGSASASQLPLISGLLGSATSAQLPPVLRLYGTTTEQAAGDFGQLYVQSSSGSSGDVGNLLLHFDGAGSSTTIVNSATGTETATAYGNAAISTQTAVFGQSVYLDGNGDYIEVTENNIFSYPAGTDFDIKFRIYYDTVGDSGLIINGDAVDYATGWEIWHQGGSTLKLMDMNNSNIFVSASWTPSVAQWYAVRVCREGTTYNLFVDGSVLGSSTTATALNHDNANLTIGRRFNGVGSPESYFKGFIDELKITKGASGGLGTYTVEASPYGLSYTQYSAKYDDPVNGNTVFEILTTGTVATKASYIYNNATTTVWGLGTNTAVTGTSSGAYAGWTNRPIRVLAVDIGSSKEIKENIKTIKIKPDLLDAEGMAKQSYVANNKMAWIAANGGSYTTVVNETGTGSVAVVDTGRMETDYNNHIELKWASDLNQDVYTETVQKQHEKGFWQMYNSVTPKSWNPKDSPGSEYEGFIVEEMPDVVKGDDGQSINLMSVVAYMSVVQQALKADTIFALSALKELLTTGTVTQQKIDYVQDRLDVLNP